MLRACIQQVWQQEFSVSFFYFSPGFRFIGSGGFGHLDRDNWTDFIVGYTGWHIWLFSSASDYLSLFGLD
jgi:hypothetical protein